MHVHASPNTKEENVRLRMLPKLEKMNWMSFCPSAISMYQPRVSGGCNTKPTILPFQKRH